MCERPKKRVCFRQEQPDLIDNRESVRRPFTLDIASVKTTITPYLFNQTREPVLTQISDESNTEEDEEIIQELEKINSLISELDALKVAPFTDSTSKVKLSKKDSEKAFIFENSGEVHLNQFDFTKQAQTSKEGPLPKSPDVLKTCVASPNRRRPFKGHRSVYCFKTNRVVKK